jgi:hypothetical protein
MNSAENDAPIFPKIVALLDERFDPKTVSVGQVEWENWKGSSDVEVRERITARLHPKAIHLNLKEWEFLKPLIYQAMGPLAQAAAEQLIAAPPYAPNDLIVAVPEPLSLLIMRFRSANSCPTDRIHIQRIDWAAIRPLALKDYLIAKADDDGTQSAKEKALRGKKVKSESH